MEKIYIIQVERTEYIGGLDPDRFELVLDYFYDTPVEAEIAIAKNIAKMALNANCEYKNYPRKLELRKSENNSVVYRYMILELNKGKIDIE